MIPVTLSGENAIVATGVVKKMRKKQKKRLVISGLAFLLSFTSLAATAEARILIFISSSMPKASLMQWFSQAQVTGAPLILRGLVNNSLPETRRWMTSFIEASHDSGGIEINPLAFEAYHITEVPAVVVTQGILQCLTNQACIAPPFDVVVGNISLFSALKNIAEKGEVGSDIARQALSKQQEAT
jgi:conjugal transfer pilus assembly protein TrbC